jgi:hypothetical protein
MNTDLFCHGGLGKRRDKEKIRESKYQVAGHQENRISGKGGLRGKF